MFFRSVLIVAACVAATVVWVCEGQAQGPVTADNIRESVTVHYRGRSYDVQNVSRSSKPGSIALAKTSAGDTRIICSVGDGVLGKSNIMVNRGRDPGECVLFLDPVSGRVERTSYHTPRPEHLVTSPDGKYVAMASLDGWVATEKSIDSIQIDKFCDTRDLPPDVVKEGLMDVAVGTLRYSIWNTTDAIPLWEMRFYGKLQKEGEAAQFQRPWNSYAKLAFPWWAMCDHAIMYRDCRIGFSPDSCYFVALDEAHGIHILRLKQGTQFHCCRASYERSPLFFYFPGSEGQMSVVFDDLTVRQIDLASGEETVEGSYELPPSAFARSSKESTRLDEFNFIPLSHPLISCVIADGNLMIHNVAELRRVNLLGTITGFGSREGISRMEMSADQQYLGISYEWSGFWPTGSGVVVMYEVADVKAGVITRRVGSAGMLARRGENAGAVTIETTGRFRACLGDDGDDIVYVEPFQRK